MAALLSPPPESMKELDVLLAELRHAKRAGLTRHMAAERTGFDRDKVRRLALRLHDKEQLRLYNSGRCPCLSCAEKPDIHYWATEHAPPRADGYNVMLKDEVLPMPTADAIPPPPPPLYAPARSLSSPPAAPPAAASVHTEVALPADAAAAPVADAHAAALPVSSPEKQRCVPGEAAQQPAVTPGKAAQNQNTQQQRQQQQVASPARPRPSASAVLPVADDGTDTKAIRIPPPPLQSVSSPSKAAASAANPAAGGVPDATMMDVAAASPTRKRPAAAAPVAPAVAPAVKKASMTQQGAQRGMPPPAAPRGGVALTLGVGPSSGQAAPSAAPTQFAPSATPYMRVAVECVDEASGQFSGYYLTASDMKQLGIEPERVLALYNARRAQRAGGESAPTIVNGGASGAGPTAARKQHKAAAPSAGAQIPDDWAKAFRRTVDMCLSRRDECSLDAFKKCLSVSGVFGDDADECIALYQEKNVILVDTDSQTVHKV